MCSGAARSNSIRFRVCIRSRSVRVDRFATIVSTVVSVLSACQLICSRFGEFVWNPKWFVVLLAALGVNRRASSSSIESTFFRAHLAERGARLSVRVCVCLVLDRFFFLFPVCLSEKVQSIGEAIQPTSRRRESSPFCFWLRTCVELCTPFEQVSGANSLQKPAIASRRLSLENSLSDFSVLRSA